MAMEMWQTLKESITAYTGLSPATLFTVVALALVTFNVLSGLFGSSSSSSSNGGGGHYQKSMENIGGAAAAQPLPPPVQVGEITEEELKQYDGSDPNKPLLMAIKGQIYDVSQSRGFYGPGGPYALFAGKDASRALAKMSFDDKDLTGDVSGLGMFEQEALRDWEYTFMSKYAKVGTVKKSVPASDTTANGEPPQAAANGEVSKPAEAGDDHAPKPVEVIERDVSKPVEATDHDGAKPSEGSPAETAAGDSNGGASVVGADKKE